MKRSNTLSLLEVDGKKSKDKSLCYREATSKAIGMMQEFFHLSFWAMVSMKQQASGFPHDALPPALPPSLQHDFTCISCTSTLSDILITCSVLECLIFRWKTAPQMVFLSGSVNDQNMWQLSLQLWLGWFLLWFGWGFLVAQCHCDLYFCLTEGFGF